MKRNDFKAKRPARLSLVIPPAEPARQTFLPPKLHDAINASLTADCGPEGVKLHRHLLTAHDYIETLQQPDIDIVRGDKSVIQTLLNSENARQPELKLSYFTSLTDFASWLSVNKNRCGEHVRFLVATSESEYHHYYVDCYFTGVGEYNSLIFIESAGIMGFTHQSALIKFKGILNIMQVNNVRVAVIDAHVQCSPADCMIFCLSFALKSLKHKSVFIEMHQKHSANNYLRLNCKPLPAQNFYVYPVYSSTLLPTDFMRHAHSRSVYKNVFKQLSPAERLDAENRIDSLYQDRYGSRGKSQYLVSIEHKRLQLIRRALIQMGAISFH